MVPQEQDVHPDYDRYHHQHIERGRYLSSHWFVLLCEAQSSKQAGKPVLKRANWDSHWRAPRGDLSDSGGRRRGANLRGSESQRAFPLPR